MKILAFPKNANIKNPVISNLNKHLTNDVDVEIDEFNLYKPFIKKYDIFHIHWPDYFYFKSFFLTLLALVYFFIIITIFKIYNTKIIWTVHNLQPHNNYHYRINKFTMDIFTKLLDGIIVMSEESKIIAYDTYPSLKSKKISLIYHGLYDNYKNTISKEDAKVKLGINAETKVLLFFGRIDEYKNILVLIDEFNKLDDNKLVLIIAGKIQNRELEQKINNKINAPNIRKIFYFIKSDDVQCLFNASDLVVLPFKNILNSGSVMLALSFNKPVFCPNIGSLKELKIIIGEKVINTYEKFTLNEIEDILNNSENPDPKLLSKFDNQYLAKQLKQFYLEIEN